MGKFWGWREEEKDIEKERERSESKRENGDLTELKNHQLRKGKHVELANQNAR